MSASDSSQVLTKPEAVGRRSAGTADKARRPRDMAASEPGDSDAKEWEPLEPVQRKLCNEMMPENCSSPASMVGNQDPKQGMIPKLEKERSLEDMKTTNPSSVNKTAQPKKAGANATHFRMARTRHLVQRGRHA
nr:zinc finger protein 37 homolog isoform X6 [Peromyscus maniculatus bairdii]